MQVAEKYNGWSNYETWVVNLWINNEESSYRYWQKVARTVIGLNDSKDEAISMLADRLKGSFSTSSNEFLENAEANSRVGWICDLLHGALSDVNWYELAKGLLS